MYKRQGFVHTVEPGIYFIPELIDLWRGEKKFMDFIDYDKVLALSAELRTLGLAVIARCV